MKIGTITPRCSACGSDQLVKVEVDGETGEGRVRCAACGFLMKAPSEAGAAKAGEKALADLFRKGLKKR